MRKCINNNAQQFKYENCINKASYIIFSILWYHQNYREHTSAVCSWCIHVCSWFLADAAISVARVLCSPAPSVCLLALYLMTDTVAGFNYGSISICYQQQINVTNRSFVSQTLHRKEPSANDQARRLLDVIERRGSLAYSNLVDVLSQSDTHRHLANLLNQEGGGVGLTDAKYGQYASVTRRQSVLSAVLRCYYSPLCLLCMSSSGGDAQARTRSPTSKGLCRKRRIDKEYTRRAT